MNDIEKYIAKLDGETIIEHNNYLKKVKNNIIDIYGISKKMEYDLDVCINNHDLGKVVSSFQDNIASKRRTIRHEILSASIKNLTDEQRLSIITHHKDLDTLKRYLENEYYESEVNEMKDIIGEEPINVMDFIRKINISRSGKKLIKNIDNILLKGYLQYCDHMGSGHNTHIDKGFDALDKYKFNNYNSIQEKVLECKKGEDVLIVAPCGLGKTATSMYWGDINQNKNKSKRIYYLLPLISCINSIYKDMNSNDISVGMLHSKAEYFLNKFESKDDYKLLKKSVKQINVCTIYQICKAIFSCKNFEMLLCQMKNGLFIIDEIHCFDMEQLALLLETLKFLKDNLNIRICIMSASIPTVKQDLIKEKLGIDNVIYAEKNDYKIRHKIFRMNKNIEDDLDKIKCDLENGKKVIICVNSVDKAQYLYDKLEIYNPCMIHGRYNTVSRELQERNLKNEDTKLLIGTQAIEVSLDISFNKMYTEIAPFDSLQQRFGRINRRAEMNKLGEINIYNCKKSVYDDNIIINTDEVISDIINYDNNIILESKTQYYLDMVYENIDTERYDKKSKDIKKVIDNLKIATYYKNAIEDMCNINSIQVIPLCLFDRYKYMYQIDRMSATSLLVNISNYNSFKSEVIYDECYNVYVADFKYTDEKGLEFSSDLII